MNEFIAKNTWVTIHVNSQFFRNISPIIRKKLKSDLTDGQKDNELIWGGLGNLRFLQVNTYNVESTHLRILTLQYLSLAEYHTDDWVSLFFSPFIFWYNPTSPTWWCSGPPLLSTRPTCFVPKHKHIYYVCWMSTMFPKRRATHLGVHRLQKKLIVFYAN